MKLIFEAYVNVNSLKNYEVVNSINYVPKTF